MGAGVGHCTDLSSGQQTETQKSLKAGFDGLTSLLGQIPSTKQCYDTELTQLFVHNKLDFTTGLSHWIK